MVPLSKIETNLRVPKNHKICPGYLDNKHYVHFFTSIILNAFQKYIPKSALFEI